MWEISPRARNFLFSPAPPTPWQFHAGPLPYLCTLVETCHIGSARDPLEQETKPETEQFVFLVTQYMPAGTKSLNPTTPLIPRTTPPPVKLSHQSDPAFSHMSVSLE